MPVTRLTRQIFSWDLQYSTCRGTWSYNAKHILNDIGQSENFEHVIPCCIDTADIALTETDNMNWDIRRYESDKLRYYNLYKHSKYIEEYTTNFKVS